MLIFSKLVCIFYVCNSSIEIDLIKHNLFFTMIFLLSLFFGNFCFFRHRDIFYVGLILDLLFIYYNRVCVVLNCFFVTSKPKFGISLAEIVLYHMVITVLKRFSNVLQGRFVLLKLVVKCWDQIVNKTIFLIRNETMS